MAENEGIDLSRVVNLIMENPKLIEEISSLVKKDKPETFSPSEADSANAASEVIDEPQKIKATYENKGLKSNHRTELLGAMKPYLSKERAKAIDSMLTIVDILDMMKGR